MRDIKSCQLSVESGFHTHLNNPRPVCFIGKCSVLSQPDGRELILLFLIRDEPLFLGRGGISVEEVLCHAFGCNIDRYGFGKVRLNSKLRASQTLLLLAADVEKPLTSDLSMLRLKYFYGLQLSDITTKSKNNKMPFI